MNSARTLAAFGGLVLALVLGVALVLGIGGWGSGEDDSVRAGLSAVDALAGGDTAGYARAEGPRPFEFPADHGPHPDYRTEWWYLTGNLESAEGRPFGFQLTFFRSALSPEAPERASDWNTRQLWMAHVAVTDVETGAHIAAERFSRGAAGLAGAHADPFRVWLHDWELASVGESTFPMRLFAVHDSVALELVLDEGKGSILQGEDGWSRKGPEPGNASYYLTWPRMPARGTITIDGQPHTVAGEAWMDREWSTSALGPENTGWDWFSLQLSDGRELMVFELRRADGAPDPMNQGSLVGPDGSVRHLTTDDFQVEVLDHWESPVDGTRYPAGWRVRVPDESLDLRVTPRVADQEMRLSFRYWEGSVQVTGSTRGVGYVELTGYAESGAARGR